MAVTAERLLLSALLLAPWAGVGLVHILARRVLGAGVQPAYLPMLFLIALIPWLHPRWRDIRSWSLPLVALLAWVALTTTASWTADSIGLAGEAPWSKGIKQLILFGFFALAASATALIVARVELRAIERATSLGLLLACAVALLQGAAFHLGPLGEGWLGHLTSSNPSIASGSAELYLGDRFVGIPRLRGPFPEPLHFGSYLIAALPVVLAGVFSTRGWSRVWRTLTFGLAATCLILTFSRGAWGGAFVAAVILAVGAMRGLLPLPRLRVVAVVAATSAAVGVVGWWTLTGVAPWDTVALLGDRVGQTAVTHDMSNLTRLWSWKAAWSLFLDHPVSGIGFGQFGFWFFDRAAEGADAAHFGWPVVNSLPLLILCETGLVGAFLVASCLWPILRVVFRPGPSVGPIAAYVVSAAFLGVAAHSLTFSQWDLPHLWLLVGCGVGLGLRAPRVV